MKESNVSMGKVAKEAGVSKMTVSRVIRGEKTVRLETRNRVTAVMEQLGYVPSSFAQSLRSNDKLRASGSRLIVAIFGSGTDSAVEFFHDVMKGIENTTAEYGLCPIQLNWQSSEEGSWKRLQTIFSIHGLCGALLIGHFSLQEIKLIHGKLEHLVVVDGPVPKEEGIAAVESDYLEGSLIALNHLIEKNCRKILILTVQKNHYFSRSIEMASNIAGQAGITIDIEYNCFTTQNAFDIVQSNWKSGNVYDGIFTTDEFNIGVIKALFKLGKSIPDDVKLIGFDDTHYATFLNPTLSSIRIDKYQLGAEAVKSLISLVRSNGANIEVKKVIRPSLIVRESTG